MTAMTIPAIAPELKPLEVFVDEAPDETLVGTDVWVAWSTLVADEVAVRVEGRDEEMLAGAIASNVVSPGFEQLVASPVC